MSTANGKQKPHKAPKKEARELDDDDLALKAKLKAEKEAKEALAKKLAKK